MFWRKRGREDTRDANGDAPESASESVSEAASPTTPDTHESELHGEPYDDGGARDADGDARASATAGPSVFEPIPVERDAPRPAQISRAAQELEARRNETVVELFEEVESPQGRALLPIHTRRESGEDAFFEVQTVAWEDQDVENLLGIAAILRSSSHADAAFEVLSAYPIPDEVRFFSSTSPAALFQLDLLPRVDPDNPERCAAAFVDTAARRWDVTLDHAPASLPLVEELLTAALRGDPESESHEGATGRAPVLDALVLSLGCYVGETLLRSTATPGSWKGVAGDWGEGPTLEFEGATADPVGKARAFLEDGPEDSIAFYVDYALEELGRGGHGRAAPGSGD
jgi:hypothetical protein